MEVCNRVKHDIRVRPPCGVAIPTTGQTRCDRSPAQEQPEGLSPELRMGESLGNAQPQVCPPGSGGATRLGNPTADTLA